MKMIRCELSRQEEKGHALRFQSGIVYAGVSRDRKSELSYHTNGISAQVLFL